MEKPVSNKPDKTTNPNSNDVETQVGKAWSLHYHGQNDAALDAFNDILTRFADNIDANYPKSLFLKPGLFSTNRSFGGLP